MYKFIMNVSIAFENKNATVEIGDKTIVTSVPSIRSSEKPSPTPKKY